jgi:hypothetical protein
VATYDNIEILMEQNQIDCEQVKYQHKQNRMQKHGVSFAGKINSR